MGLKASTPGMLMVATALWLTAGAALGQPPASKVYVAEARLELLEPLRETTGEIRAARRSRVAAEESGRVVQIRVEPGDRVEEGDLLAELDATYVKIDLRRREATVARDQGNVREAEIELARANRDLKRIEGLQRQSASSRTEFEDAQSDVGVAEAKLEQAKADLDAALAELDRAKERLDDMTIEAPFSGRVVDRFTDIGEWVDGGDSVVELVALDEVDVFIDVPQQFITALRETEREVSIRIEATGEILESNVTEIVPVADSLSRMFPVRLRMANGDEKYKPGMSVVGLIPTGKVEERLAVPKDAIRRDDVGAFLFEVSGGVAQVRRVTPLYAKEDLVVLRPGDVAPGAQVVTEGNERLFPGAPVMILNATPDDDGGAVSSLDKGAR